ncbi:MAG TPA: G8 domain-containing protein, partial [Arachidicoccus soli]|nr:G8 domain-containing protein [Arachidicoccus soli]
MKLKILSVFLLSFLTTTYVLFGNINFLSNKLNFIKNNEVTEKALIEQNAPICGNNQKTSSIINLADAEPMLWSDASTWTSFGATKPVAGSLVTIPADKYIILDESTPNLAGLTINGKLEFADKNINLTSGWILVTGKFSVGSEAVPYTKQALITLNATNPNEQVMGMGTRGIIVMGGKLELHGTPPTKSSTKLNDNAAAGSTNLVLADPVTWNVNDQIVIATTDYYSDPQFNAPPIRASAQRTQITATAGTSLTIGDGLNAQRWGKLQYLTSTGMSLTPGVLPANLPEGTPTVLDERAEVANLTRNIVVQSVDDNLWQDNGFGCHIMIMRSNGVVGEAHINGVEIRRGGQAGKLGRYPFHWHMLSYGSNATLPDVTGQYIRNSTVNQSSQRGIVIHATNGAEVSNNVIYDVRGHGIFTEDASERRNVINGNLVLKVRNPLPENLLKFHESWQGSRGSSGFWISNPDNTITNNTAVDCSGIGFWLAFPSRTFGASASSGVTLNPSLTKFGTFNNNHAHSNQFEGIFLDGAEIDEEGNTNSIRYTSTADMKEPEWPWSTVLTYELADYSTWKNGGNGIWNRSSAPMNRRVINADNAESFFAGSIDNKESAVPAFIEKSLVVGTSLNYNMNGIEYPNVLSAGTQTARRAFASYHSSVDIRQNTVVNFPAVKDKASGLFAMDDYYINPVDKGQVRNTDNILVNSHPGVRTLPREPQFTFGVIWFPYDYWGGSASQNHYYVFDNPFFTHGLTKNIVSPGPEVSGGVIVDGPFYGFSQYYTNNIERRYDKINVVRTDLAGNTVGNWTVEGGHPGDLLGNMRHFAAHPSGYYYLDFPTIDNVNKFQIMASGMLTENDYQVLAVEYSGDYTISNLYSSTAHNASDFGTALP